MNSEETLALWRQGKDAWATWVRGVLEKKKALEKAGKWSVDWYGEGQNEETKAWLEEATASFAAAAFETGADFRGMRFPGPADFDGARFADAADFSNTQFEGNVCFEGAQLAAATFTATKCRGFANFDKVRIAGEANFDKAEFLKVSDLEPCARFHRAQFAGLAEFAGAHFAGAVQFVKAAFSDVRFDGCAFDGDTLFTSAQFDQSVSFIKTRFTGARVDFREAQFRGDTRFLEAHFGGSWGGLVISGACCVTFEAARFERETSFRQTWFVGDSEFRNALFNGVVKFDDALFVMPARFAPAVFSAAASFKDAQFVHEGDFSGARFLEDCDFSGAKFGGEAWFRQVRFAGPAQFAGAEFAGAASFYGASAEAAFGLDGARCTAVPDFGEVNFAQSPALGALVMIKPKRRWFRWWTGRRKAGRPLLARWTKAAAVSGPHEYRQPEFVPAQEEADPAPGATGAAEPAAPVKTSAAARIAAELVTDSAGERSATQEPKADAVLGVESSRGGGQERRFRVLRFAAGRGSASGPAEPLAAHGQSGNPARRRSMLRPLLVWGISVAAFVPFYLGQRPSSHGSNSAASFLPGWPPLSWDGAPAWLNAPASAIWDGLGWLSGTAVGAFSTGPCVHGGSLPGGEALFLSAKNALVFVPWENEHVIRRVYGCLYGLDGSEPIIPVAVSLASLMQATLSVVLFAMIFIALRERLKKK